MPLISKGIYFATNTQMRIGRYLSEERFRQDSGDLYHFFEVPGTNLCGGVPPIFTTCLRQLEEVGVGLIITLTVAPLIAPPSRWFPPGRYINHSPLGANPDRVEYADGDIDLNPFSYGLEMCHVPIDDGGIPSVEMETRLVDVVREFCQRQPTKKIYVHCWKGGGRTSTILIRLMQLRGFLTTEAASSLERCNLRYSLSRVQSAYVCGDPFRPPCPTIWLPLSHPAYCVFRRGNQFIWEMDVAEHDDDLGSLSDEDFTYRHFSQVDPFLLSLYRVGEIESLFNFMLSQEVYYTLDFLLRMLEMLVMVDGPASIIESCLEMIWNSSENDCYWNHYLSLIRTSPREDIRMIGAMWDSIA